MRRAAQAFALLALSALLLAAPAASKPRAAKVDVGGVSLSAAGHGRASLLVPVRYPIQMLGRRTALKLTLLRPDGHRVRSWTVHDRAGGGLPRSPERRRRFTFVHRIGLDQRLTQRLDHGWRVLARARSLVDADGDGEPELRSVDRAEQPLRLAGGKGGKGRNLCSTVPLRRAKPGRPIRIGLPDCATRVHWRVQRAPEGGRARIRGDMLIYRSARRFRGTDSLVLGGGKRAESSGGSGGSGGGAQVLISVGSAQDTVVRAMGDSVTAGFGYYDDGSLMHISNLFECKPADAFYDDACSSNSEARVNSLDEVKYAPDFGLSNNVSWAAQWANEHGITDYANYAVSGSEPSQWAPEGVFHRTTEQIESEGPDYILMTMGANPLLDDMLFGVDNMGCAIFADIFGNYRACIEKAFDEVHLRTDLKSLYTDLVKNTDATIYLMQYHLSVPSSALAYTATQIAQMGQLLNAEISSVAAEVGSPQLQVVAPPHFNVGLSVEPVYPSSYSCSSLGYKVDGPSVQSTPTQDELELAHYLSFCSGPVPEGPNWVISGDTGIHPSTTGYAQMASQVPAPR